MAVSGPKTALGRLARGAKTVCSVHAHATGGPRDAPRWKRSAGRRKPAPMRRRAAVTLATTTAFRFTSLWARKRRTDGNF